MLYPYNIFLVSFNFNLWDFFYLLSFFFIFFLFTLLMQTQNFLFFFICIELLNLVISFFFILFSVFLQNIVGEVFVFWMLTVATGEAVLVFSLIFLMVNTKSSIRFKDFHQLNS